LVLGVCANTSRKSFSSRRASSRSAATYPFGLGRTRHHAVEDVRITA
jgi:hypothetical protein